MSRFYVPSYWGVVAATLALAAVLLAGPTEVVAKGSISKVESEFEKAIKKVTPAACVCLPWGVDPKLIIGGSSGVIMSRKGLVLSDGDVGIYLKERKRGAKRLWSDQVEIRLPNLKGKGFRSFKARVIKRDRSLDTTLMRIEKVPSSLKYLKVGNSDDLKVGDFTFAMGNSFGLAAEAPPTLTAGVVASLTPAASKEQGRFEHIYTSAAVNQGVNGGPLVDIHGHLVGTISNVVALRPTKEVKADDPRFRYAYLGKVIPVSRLRAVYKDLPEFSELFPENKKPDPKKGESSALATVFHHTGRRAYRSVVSLGIKRKQQLSLAEPGPRGNVNVPRYLGPVSGVLISRDGYILTSLYNLANLIGLVMPQLGPRLPPNAKVSAGVDGIESITAYLPDGRGVPATVYARHEGLGIALLKADLTATGTSAAGNAEGKGAVAGASQDGGGTVTSLEIALPAPKDTLRAGRFVLNLGNPFGAGRLDDPLLTVGVLSKQHADTSRHPWASQWQTDAGVTDANAGGACVDLRGRLLGIITIWSSTQHGRNSGIGFVVPWDRIEPILGELKRGRSFRPPFFGITWKVLGGLPTTILETVLAGKAAATAGLKPGDEIIKIDGKPVEKPNEVRAILKGRWSGDHLMLVIRRGGKELEIDLELGARE